MTQWSFPHEGIITGDCGPYTSDQFARMMRDTMAVLSSEEGVIAGSLNELAATGVVSPITVDTGSALVNGRYYTNDVAVNNLVVDTPAAATRHDLLVLRHSWAAQTVRLAIKKNPAEGAAHEVPTRIFGTTWELALYEVDIAMGGAITLTDVREFVHPTAPVFRRQGGNASNWEEPGTDNYHPGKAVIQCGSVEWVDAGGAEFGAVVVTFETPFAFIPLAWVSSGTGLEFLGVTPAVNQLGIGWASPGVTHFALTLYWLAIGPRA